MTSQRIQARYFIESRRNCNMGAIPSWTVSGPGQRENETGFWTVRARGHRVRSGHRTLAAGATRRNRAGTLNGAPPRGAAAGCASGPLAGAKPPETLMLLGRAPSQPHGAARSLLFVPGAAPTGLGGGTGSPLGWGAIPDRKSVV